MTFDLAVKPVEYRFAVPVVVFLGDYDEFVAVYALYGTVLEVIADKRRGFADIRVARIVPEGAVYTFESVDVAHGGSEISVPAVFSAA